MLNEIVCFFLGLSLLLYCLLAGADFGAGILECVMGKKNREEQKDLIDRAVGPVWEANHVWLILAIVILFTGFPKVYSALSISFHIPLTLALIGIIMRGCAFTFRHYNAVQDRSQNYYDIFFRLSSVFTPFLFGVVAGGVLLGRTAHETSSFSERFVLPWFNLFSFSVGLFACVLFSFLAAVYLVGEAEDNEAVKKIFMKRARILNGIALVVGLLVFVAAWSDGLPLISRFLLEPISLGAMTFATLLLIPLWFSLEGKNAAITRLLGALIVSAVLLGWFKLQFPVLFVAEPFGKMTIYNAAAPPATLRLLLYALGIGSLLIFPSLFYLMKIFKLQNSKLPI